MAKTLIPYYGGKFYMLKHILSMIPAHTHYIEPFGGSGVVLFNKKPSKLETYNDLNSNLVNFFRVLQSQEKIEKLMEFLKYPFYSREEFYYCRKNIDNEPNEIKKAYMFFYISINCIAGGGRKSKDHNFAYGINSSKRAKKYVSKIDQIRYFADRLRYVQVENKDAIELTSDTDSKDHFIYIDPPYLHSTRLAVDNCYMHEYTDDQHEKLIDFLICAKSKILLSGYDNEIYGRLEDSGFRKKMLDVVNFSARGSSGTKRFGAKESLWYNYDIGQTEFNFE